MNDSLSNNSGLITRSSQQIVKFFNALDRMLEGVEQIASLNRPFLNGERYLSEKEVSEVLNVSRRTLHDYRNEGRISYYKLGGKILYKESDIQQFLEIRYQKSFR